MIESWLAEIIPYFEAGRRLEGWSLEHAPERVGPGPPWDYEALAREAALAAHSVVDLGTGGGEVFERVLGRSRARAVATEGWHVNAPVAARRLGPRVSVVRADSLALPFADKTFDLVLSRHEEISAAEIARVLRPGATFLTQQVISRMWHELGCVFPDWVVFPDHFSEYPQGLAAAGLRVEQTREHRFAIRFRSLGPLVYHLAAAPWMLPDFSIETHREGLDALRERIQRDGALVLTDGYYLVRASAPGGRLRP